MLTTNENALREQGVETANETTNKAKRTTKLCRVIEALKQPHGLNRFEAEGIGCHCLNTSVAVVRAMYGERLIQRWERVPSRFNPDGVRVYRYWLLPEAV